MIKLIATDLDGTLLRKDDSISQRTIDVLRKCQKAGIKIAFATSRSEGASRRFVDIIKPDVVIANSGGKIICNGEIIYKSKLDSDTVEGIIGQIRSTINEKSVITTETDEGYFSNVMADDSYLAGFRHPIYCDYKDFHHSAYKITASIADKDKAEKIAAGFKDCALICFRGEDWKCFLHRDSRKSKAVEILAEYLNISMSEVAAFGDDYSDMEMLESCGIGVAVENSLGAVKKIADCVTGSCDDDGVAEFIEKNIL